jgi:hypothetical protein
MAMLTRMQNPKRDLRRSDRYISNFVVSKQLNGVPNGFCFALAHAEPAKPNQHI